MFRRPPTWQVAWTLVAATLMLATGAVRATEGGPANVDEQPVVAAVPTRLHPAPIPPARRDTWIPPGFEDLAAPQTTLVDVFYGGDFLISTMVRFSLDEVVILHPEAVADRLPDLIDPRGFTEKLARAFYPNSELLCRSKYQQDCELIETDDVDLIFDRHRLQLSLFIGSPLLRTRTTEQMKYLPASDAGASIMNDTAAYYSGFVGEDLTYNVASESVFAFAESRISARSNLTDTHGLEVDELAFRREFRGRDLQLGLFRSNIGGFTFLQNQQFIGVNAESSLTTRANVDYALASDVTVFLHSRSRVEIFKDGRLLQSGFYNPGNQVLDTSNLPSGAYDVEIRITDSAGRVTTQPYYFSKTPRLPPTDQALYFFQAGRETVGGANDFFPETADQGFVRAGLRKRLGASTGGGAALSLNGDSVLVESSLFKQGRNLQAELSAAFESLGIAGVDLGLRYSWRGANLAASARRVWHVEQQPVAQEAMLVDDPAQIGAATTQYSTTFSMPAWKGRFGGFFRYSERDGSALQNYGLNWSASGWSVAGGTLAANIEVSRNDGSVFGAIRLSYRFSREAWSGGVSATLEGNKASDRAFGVDPRGRAEMRWRSDESFYNDYEFALAASSESERDVEAYASVASDMGTAETSVRWIDSTSRTEIRGQLGTRFAATPQSLSFGGRGHAQSAVLVGVDAGEGSDAEFEVLVDTVKRATLRAGQTRLIALGAFRTYDVEVRSVGDTFASLNKTKERTTVYPGNVLSLNWKAKRIFVGMGRLVDKDGEPIRNALIKNASGLATTDEYGFFQAELDQSAEMLAVQKRGSSCLVDLGEFEVVDQVSYLGTLTCTMSS